MQEAMKKEKNEIHCRRGLFLLILFLLNSFPGFLPSL